MSFTFAEAAAAARKRLTPGQLEEEEEEVLTGILDPADEEEMQPHTPQGGRRQTPLVSMAFSDDDEEEEEAQAQGARGDDGGESGKEAAREIPMSADLAAPPSYPTQLWPVVEEKTVSSINRSSSLTPSKASSSSSSSSSPLHTRLPMSFSSRGRSSFPRGQAGAEAAALDSSASPTSVPVVESPPSATPSSSLRISPSSQEDLFTSDAPLPLPSPYPVAAFATVDNSSRTISFLPTNTLTNSTASSTHPAMSSSVGLATHKSEQSLLDASSASGPQLNLEICMGTINELKNQLVQSNRSVERLAAENVALQRELSGSGSSSSSSSSSSRRISGGSLASSTLTASARFGTSAASSSRRVLPKMVGMGYTGGSAGPPTPLSLSLAAAQASNRTSGPNSSIWEDMTPHAKVLLQQSIEDNTRTLATFIEMVSMTQKVMEAQGMSSSKSPLSSATSGAPSAAQEELSMAGMKEELQDAVANMAALRQQFEGVLEEHRSYLAAGKEEPPAVTPLSKEERIESNDLEHQRQAKEAFLQNEVQRLQRQVNIMAAHMPKEHKQLIKEIKHLKEECARLRIDAHAKAAENHAVKEELEGMKTSLRRSLELTRRRNSGAANHKFGAPSTVPGTKKRPSLRPHGLEVAQQEEKSKEALEKEVAKLQKEAADLEHMLRIQLQIKSNVVRTLEATNVEVRGLREQLRLPAHNTNFARDVVNYNNSIRLKHLVSKRHEDRAQKEKEAEEEKKRRQTQSMSERHRHTQELLGKQAQLLKQAQQEARERAQKQQGASSSASTLKSSLKGKEKMGFGSPRPDRKCITQGPPSPREGRASSITFASLRKVLSPGRAASP